MLIGRLTSGSHHRLDALRPESGGPGAAVTAIGLMLKASGCKMHDAFAIAAGGAAGGIATYTPAMLYMNRIGA